MWEKKYILEQMIWEYTLKKCILQQWTLNQNNIIINQTVTALLAGKHLTWELIKS